MSGYGYRYEGNGAFPYVPHEAITQVPAHNGPFSLRYEVATGRVAIVFKTHPSGEPVHLLVFDSESAIQSLHTLLNEHQRP